MSGKPFAQPLLRPVTGADGKAKPGVSDFMAEAGPAEMAASGHGALREEDDVWAAENGGENSLVRARPAAAPRAAFAACACCYGVRARS